MALEYCFSCSCHMASQQCLLLPQPHAYDVQSLRDLRVLAWAQWPPSPQHLWWRHCAPQASLGSEALTPPALCSPPSAALCLRTLVLLVLPTWMLPTRPSPHNSTLHPCWPASMGSCLLPGDYGLDVAERPSELNCLHLVSGNQTCSN